MALTREYTALLRAQLAELDRLDAALAQQHARLKDAFESLPPGDRTIHNFRTQEFMSDFEDAARSSDQGLDHDRHAAHLCTLGQPGRQGDEAGIGEG